jgi:Undecaprenyl-phosphate galactose phosphotransferase WbaP
VSFLAAFVLRRFLGEQGLFFSPLRPELGFFLGYWPIVILWPLIFWREGLYLGAWLEPEEELRRILEGTTIASLLVIASTFLTQTGPEFSRPILAGWWMLCLILVPLHHAGIKHLFRSLHLGRPTVIVGEAGPAQEVIAALRRKRFMALDPVAVFTDDNGRSPDQMDGVPVAGEIEHAQQWADERRIDTVLIVRPDLPNAELVRITDYFGARFRHVYVIPDLSGMSTAETDIRNIEGTLTLEVRKNLLLRRNQVFKRILDLLVTLILAVLAAPIMFVIGLALALERQGSVMFGHRRIGKDGQSFVAWKFRTMVRDADEVLARALAGDQQLQAEWAASQKLLNDPRLTPIGRLLRRLSMDELPQIWNILRGEMSLVGPRPIVAHEIEKYGEAFQLYTQVLPGLTGLWQVSGRSMVSYPVRVRLDSYYVRNWSIWLDLVIIIRTFVVVLSGTGAY